MIAGSRSFNDYDTLCYICDRSLANQKDFGNIIIVSGGARGADSLAERYAHEHGCKLKVFPAKWHLYGKGAGYRRNTEMQKYISTFEQRCILCFWDGFSPGTKHNFELAKFFGNPIRVYNYTLKKFIKV